MYYLLLNGGLYTKCSSKSFPYIRIDEPATFSTLQKAMSEAKEQVSSRPLLSNVAILKEVCSASEIKRDATIEWEK